MKEGIISGEIILRNICKYIYGKYSKSQNGRARLKYCAPIFKKYEGIWVVELRKHGSTDLFDIKIKSNEIDFNILTEIEKGVEVYLNGDYENAN